MFAAQELSDTRPLDLLINNAGVMALATRQTSPDGHELQFATNVLGSFRLTGQLLPALLRAPAPRIVNVASGAHKAGGPLPLEDLDSTEKYGPIKAYAKTKLANILFTRELQRRAGDRLLVVACHPGAAKTNLAGPSSFLMKAAGLLIYPIVQSAEMGAEGTLMAATLPSAKPAGYYGPQGFLELRGHPGEAEIAAFAHDDVAAAALFEQLTAITGVTYDL